MLTTTRRARKAGAITGLVAFLGASLLGGAAPANATEVDTPKALNAEELESHGVDTSDTAVREEIEKIRSEGGKIYDAEVADYEADVEEGEIVPQVYPGDCGLTVLMWRNSLTIHSSSVTSCEFPYSTAEMDNTINFYAWLHWIELSGNIEYSSNATTFTNRNSYSCVNSNDTEFRTETVGEIYKDGTRYTAAAYDIFDGGDQPCGTS